MGRTATSNLTGLRKLVVGDRQYRIVYRIEEDGDVAVVWVVGSRTDGQCYDMALARLEDYAGRPELVERLRELLDDAYGKG